MSATLRFEGLDALRAGLRQLPAQLAQEAGTVIDRRAQNAAAAIRAVYEAHRLTGYLARHVTVSVQRETATAAATVRSNSPHSALFEFGTGSLNVVHPGGARRTDRGANRGSSPPHPTVIPIAQRERRAMTQELIAIVKRAGFEVGET